MEFFDTLCRVIFYFMIYSVVGWIYETTLCSITDRHFVNRGFLNGPYCPIYGSGALLDVLILGRIENPFLLFILGVLVTCSLEYLTSYVMEKLFKARWWDYSDKKFNIGGRVCLLGAETADKLRASSAATFTKLNNAYESFTERLNRQQRRMLKAFPKLRSANHNSTLSEIKQRFRDRKNADRGKRGNEEKK